MGLFRVSGSEKVQNYADIIFGWTIPNMLLITDIYEITSVIRFFVCWKGLDCSWQWYDNLHSPFLQVVLKEKSRIASEIHISAGYGPFGQQGQY